MEAFKWERKSESIVIGYGLINDLYIVIETDETIQPLFTHMLRIKDWCIYKPAIEQTINMNKNCKEVYIRLNDISKYFKITREEYKALINI